MSHPWSQLLSRKRLGSERQPAAVTARTDYQRDLDRIVFSSAFRRMQDKTQIFPMSQIDYVRTRLTHSLEASSIGRSLGTLVGEQVIARHDLPGVEASDFGDICAAACLAHDIGNPPFGHSGEDAIRHWAASGAYGRERVAVLKGSEREDFLRFEGNAQGFRILTRLQNPDNPGGLQLTCATLAAFTKYPRESWLGGASVPGVSARKQGFTAEDLPLFEEVAQTVGLTRRDPQRALWQRHPLAFLVEAADDISYRVIDIEDGYRLGHLDLPTVVKLYAAALPEPEQQLQRMSRISGPKEQVEFLRAKVISAAITEVVAVFLDAEDAILNGSFDSPLLDHIRSRRAMEDCIAMAREHIYCAPAVVEIQAAGFQVIGELLERFVRAVDDVADQGEGAAPQSRLLNRLVPEQFIGGNRQPSADPYRRLLGLTDFISGMTDSYAVSLYKKVTGISLPGG